jgi:hypothetical protein
MPGQSIIVFIIMFALIFITFASERYPLLVLVAFTIILLTIVIVHQFLLYAH